MRHMLRLRAIRNQRGYSLRRLSELCGVHYVSLARIESNQLDPQLSTLLKVCVALKVSLNDLVIQPGITKGGRSDGTHQKKR
jgi:transcriptional regulator with XRE-family HTH domain